MRISGIVKFGMIILGVFIAIVSWFVYVFQVANNKPFKDNINISVEEGDSLTNLLDQLSEEKLINYGLIAKASVKIFNYDTNIKPGNYAFEDTVDLENFIKSLNKGPVSDDFVKVTIPEGYSIEKMAQVLENSELNFTADEFINAVKTYELPQYIKKDDKRRYALEGFLFADTYHFDKDSTPNIVIKTMLNRFEDILNEIEQELNIKLDESKIDEIVTLASVVEREIIHDEERALAASVFKNRLDIDMPLQSCATVIYALGKHKEVLYNSDLKVESEFNTYKYPGLPIGPIASPGKASLKSVINPENTKYKYFILNDETNYHYFFENYDDFLKQKSIRDTTLNVKS